METPFVIYRSGHLEAHLTRRGSWCQSRSWWWLGWTLCGVSALHPHEPSDTALPLSTVNCLRCREIAAVPKEA